MKNKKRILIPLLIVCLLACLVTVVAFATTDSYDGVDAMEAIEADEALMAKKVDSYALSDDGYLGIPVEFTYFYDSQNGTPTPGVNGTPLIMYVVNTRTVRTGTDCDTSIIKDMLSRGYIVAVADYQYSEKAVPDDIEWSTQTVMASLRTSAYFTDESLKLGTYNESFVVPAGHNVTLNHVFWELDKHSVDGTLDKIVEVWNEDFRGYKAKKMVKWVDTEGERKATQNGYDDTEPVWYSLGTGDGSVTVDGVSYVPDEENGVYVQVKHTLAQTLTDCVKPDGSPIDLNLYMHVIYPTNPEGTVPILALASSSEHLANGGANAVRPHAYGFAFEGYAVAMFDYAYVPMARVDHYGYFDGSSPSSGSVTGDNMTYSLNTYNSAYVGPAAMRYLRYLALSDPDTYAFNGKIGVIGNSKASMYTPLANLALCDTKTSADFDGDEQALLTYAQSYLSSFGNYYYLYGHHGETRYEMGEVTYTENGATVDGGELQPWTVWDGEMISSGAQFVYSSCGSVTNNINENYAPLFTCGHIDDESSAYGANGQLINYARCYDIPMLWFEVSLGHTFVARENADFNTDPYVAYKNYVNYVLSDSPVSVVGVTPLSGSEISVTPTFTILFAGMVDESEVAKITLTDSDGNAVLGTFESSYGNTRWTFSPTTLKAGTEYTLTVPATLVGQNGVAAGEAYTATFTTERGVSTDLGIDTPKTLTDENGVYLNVTVPDLSAYSAEGVNRAQLRVFVSNEAANKLGVYLVSSESESEGEKLFDMPISGVGYYSIDLTDFLTSYESGTTLTLLLKAEKGSGTFSHTTSAFEGEDFEDQANTFSVNGISIWGYSTIDDEHGTSMTAYLRYRTSSGTHKYYATNVSLTKTGMILDEMSTDDVGRRFTVSFEVYDTVSRCIKVKLGSVSNSKTGVVDYDGTYYNFYTKAGEWVSCSFDTVIMDPTYGLTGLTSKDFYLHLTPTGDTNSKISFDNFAVTETLTDITLSEASLVLCSAGGDAYKAPSADLAFYVGDVGYATLAEAIAALGEEDTVTLMQNVTLTDDTPITGIGVESMTLDLNGYALCTAMQSTSLISFDSGVCKSVTVKNGSVYLSGTSAVGYEGVSGEKSVSVTFENLYIGTQQGAMLTTVLAANEAPTDAEITLSLKLTDCTVDMRAERFTKNPVTMISTSTDSVAITAVMYGGKVILTRPDKVSVFSKVKDIRFDDGTDGCTTFLLTASRSFDSDTMVACVDSFCYLVKSEDIESPTGYQTYSCESSELCTPYGVIPEEYADENLYPFVLFNTDTDTFLAASDVFIIDNGSGILNNIYMKQSGNYAVYLRRDFEHDIDAASYNLAFIGCNVTIDLGGNTFTNENTVGNAMLILQAKRAYNTTVTFCNGTIISAAAKPLMELWPKDKAQNFDITFKNITFGVKEGVAPTTWILKTDSTATATAVANNSLTLIDCTFDLSGVSSAITLFTVGNENGVVVDTVKLYGCNLYGDLSYLTFFTLNGTANRSVEFLRGSDGNYITNTRLTDSDVPTQIVTVADGYGNFSVPLSTKGEYTTYALGADDSLTPYGAIPEKYADSSKYPIIVFNLGTNEAVFASSLLITQGSDTETGSALGYMSGKSGSYVIYFRKSVETKIPEDASYNYNFGNCNANLTLDLGGCTVTLNHAMFYAQSKSTPTSNITVKNGTINVGTQKVIRVGSATAGKNKTMNFVFENVTFTNLNGGGLVYNEIDTPVNVTVNVTLNDCTLELTSSQTTPIFVLNGKGTLATVNVTLCGGKIVCESDSLPVIVKTDNEEMRKLTLTKGADGYTVITTASSDTVSDGVAMTTDTGIFYYVQENSETDTESVFKLGLKTEYGYIPDCYLDISSYPLIVFNTDTGEAVLGSNVLTGETAESVLYYVSCTATKNGNYAILLRADYQQTTNTAKNNWWMGNTKCNVTFDLDGHTLNLLLDLYVMQMRSSATCTITTKNGTINTGGKAVLDTGARFYNKTLNIIFEDVTFTNVKAALVKDTQYSVTETTTNVTFNNCTFEISSSLSTGIFTLGKTTSTATVNVVVCGGKFILATSTVKLFTTEGVENKSVTFDKYNGSYPTVTVGSGVSVDSLSYQTPTGAVLGLRKLSASDTDTTYAMAPLSFVSAYVNLTNDINVIYRVFVPYSITDPTVTFTIGELTETVTAFGTDENGFYLFKLSEIGPHRMGDAITATLTAQNGDTTVTAEHSGLSVKSYADTVLSENPDNTALAELIEKLLVYGAAAQLYADYNTDSLVAELGTLTDIDESEDTLTLEGTGVEDAYFDACGLYLDGAFALRVTVKATSFEGLTLEATKSGVTTSYDLSALEAVNGAVTVYYDELIASELDEDVTFTIKQNGEAISHVLTYSANAYLYIAQSSANEALSNLAKALYAYGVCASAYEG